jgi:hypothetical protein
MPWNVFIVQVEHESQLLWSSKNTLLTQFLFQCCVFRSFKLSLIPLAVCLLNLVTISYATRQNPLVSEPYIMLLPSNHFWQFALKDEQTALSNVQVFHLVKYECEKLLTLQVSHTYLAFISMTDQLPLHVRFDVFTVVTMKNGVFWDVTWCGSCKNQRLGRT